ncbi:MAG: acyl-CoA thioesterase [Rickettsiaceae bacterium]|nr:acyl-CoA thioesterase [Rickettsiaceae bacterium]
MFVENFEVRNSELDIQGVVNNSYYFTYMEHARHKIGNAIGINFVEMAQNNQNIFLISSHINFKCPLKSGDKFFVETIIVPEGKIRFAFEQVIKKNDGTIIAIGHNVCVCIDENNKRKPYIPEQIESILDKR